MLIRATESVLVVIDMQENLVPAMQSPETPLKNAALLLDAAKVCNVPSVITEQYPEGLGNTVPQIQKSAAASPVIEKIHFSCMEDSYFFDTFSALERKQAILAGMEAHVCVLQTAESMIQAGYHVFVVSDATASRTKSNHNACFTRLNGSGATIVTTEMVVFEWLGEAGTPEFKQLLPLIKH